MKKDNFLPSSEITQNQESHVDNMVSAIQDRLKLSYEERIEAHENALALCEELKKAGRLVYAKPQTTS